MRRDCDSNALPSLLLNFGVDRVLRTYRRASHSAVMEGKADTQESVRSFAYAVGTRHAFYPLKPLSSRAYLRSIPVVANINDELSRAQEADGAFNTHEDARENEIKEMKQGMKGRSTPLLSTR
jgi:hypothetical protein